MPSTPSSERSVVGGAEESRVRAGITTDFPKRAVELGEIQIGGLNGRVHDLTAADGIGGDLFRGDGARRDFGGGHAGIGQGLRPDGSRAEQCALEVGEGGAIADEGSKEEVGGIGEEHDAIELVGAGVDLVRVQPRNVEAELCVGEHAGEGGQLVVVGGRGEFEAVEAVEGIGVAWGMRMIAAGGRVGRAGTFKTEVEHMVEQFESDSRCEQSVVIHTVEETFGNIREALPGHLVGSGRGGRREGVNGVGSRPNRLTGSERHEIVGGAIGADRDFEPAGIAVKRRGTEIEVEREQAVGDGSRERQVILAQLAVARFRGMEREAEIEQAFGRLAPAREGALVAEDGIRGGQGAGAAQSEDEQGQAWMREHRATWKGNPIHEQVEFEE